MTTLVFVVRCVHESTIMHIYFYSNSNGAAAAAQPRILVELMKHGTQLSYDLEFKLQQPPNEKFKNPDQTLRPILPDVDLFILDFTHKKKDLKFIVAKASVLKKNVLCLCNSKYKDECFNNLKKWQSNNLIMHEYTNDSINKIITSFFQMISKDS